MKALERASTIVAGDCSESIPQTFTIPPGVPEMYFLTNIIAYCELCERAASRWLQHTSPALQPMGRVCVLTGARRSTRNLITSHLITI